MGKTKDFKDLDLQLGQLRTTEAKELGSAVELTLDPQKEKQYNSLERTMNLVSEALGSVKDKLCDTGQEGALSRSSFSPL